MKFEIKDDNDFKSSINLDSVRGGKGKVIKFDFNKDDFDNLEDYVEYLKKVHDQKEVGKIIQNIELQIDK